MPDGRKLGFNLDVLRWAAQLSARPQAKGKAPRPDDARLEEIDKIMHSDVDRYRREGLNREHLALMRKREAPQARTGTLALSTAF